MIIPIIILDNEINVDIKTNLLFSEPKNFETYIKCIVPGIIAILTIFTASITSRYFGNIIGMKYGITIIPNAEISIEIITEIIFNFLFGFPMASFGSKNLKTIFENIISTANICNDKA